MLNSKPATRSLPWAISHDGRPRGSVRTSGSVLLLLVLIATIVLMTCCVQRASATTTRSRRFRLCGENIPRMLGFVCGSRGYHYHFKRTSHPLFAKRTGRLDFFTGKRLKTRGIADECCVNYCTLSNLESYCASPTNAKEHEEQQRQLFSRDEVIPGVFEETTSPSPVQAMAPSDLTPMIIEEEMSSLKPHVTTPPGHSGGHAQDRHYYFDYHTYPPDSRWNIIIRKAHLR